MAHMVNGTVNQYLNSKGLSKDDIEYFDGLLLEGGRFTNYNSCTWIKDKELYRLCKFKKEKYAIMGTFEAIFMPIKDIEGNVQGLSIRMFNEQKHDSYLLERVSKPTCLFGINTAYKHILSLDRVFVVEGSYDCIAMARKGFPNTVSILGTSFSPYHFAILSSLTDNIIMCLDGDKAGIKAIHSMWKEYKDKINLFRVNINTDPDEYLRDHSSNDLVKHIENIKWRR